jgi:hypothetical protein
VKTRFGDGFDTEFVTMPLHSVNIGRTELSPYDVKKGTRVVRGGAALPRGVARRPNYSYFDHRVRRDRRPPRNKVPLFLMN